MIFDAFGRLAFGQIQQNFGNTSAFLGGVSATVSVGVITPTRLTPVNLSGVSGTATASTFTGNSSLSNGTPIGILAAITLGSLVSTGDGTKIVAPKGIGVSGTGFAGTILSGISALPTGNQATGVPGIIGNSKFNAIGISGNFASGIAGTISITDAGFSFVGVEGDTAPGTILGGVQAILGGVSATGAVGIFNSGPYSGSTVISGGGGKKPKTGLEPVKKIPQEPLKPVKLPTYVLPKFGSKLAPRLPKPVPTPFDRLPNTQPIDFMGMKKQIQEAQDSADIKAVLAFLDEND